MLSSINNKQSPTFKGYYSPQKIKEVVEMFEHYQKRVNKNLTNQDIVTIQNSLISFNAFLRGAENLNVTKLENEIYNKLNAPAKFYGDKYIAAIAGLTINIFKKLNLTLPKGYEKLSLNPKIRAMWDLNDHWVYFNSKVDWSNVQEELITERLYNHGSSGHFLKTPVHEFMHCVHYANLVKKADLIKQRIKESPSSLIRDTLGHQDIKTDMLLSAGKEIVNQKTIDLLKRNISEYGATKPVEAIAEKSSQVILDSLDSKTMLPKYNPFLNYKGKGNSQLNTILEEFWDGNFSKYI